MPQVFLVTGAGRGLGLDISEAVLAAGHRLVAGVRRPEQLDDLVGRYGDAIIPVALDVTDPAAAEAAVRTAVDTYGRLDVLVNNAGYANLAAFEDITLDDFREQVDTNLYGVVYTTKAAIPVLREQGGGHIIQISSVGGRLTSPGLSAYQSAKWAVGGFSGVVAQEVGPLGIHVTVLEPGGMRTDWGGASMTIPSVSPPYQATVGARAELQRAFTGHEAGDPAKVAQVVLRIAAMDDPPLRLLLGSDAVRYAGLAEQAQDSSDERWRSLSVSTDHPEGDTDPLRRVC